MCSFWVLSGDQGCSTQRLWGWILPWTTSLGAERGWILLLGCHCPYLGEGEGHGVIGLGSCFAFLILQVVHF